jgi:colanic acid/amylovoran biosynthesis glycosyltransferase
MRSGETAAPRTPHLRVVHYVAEYLSTTATFVLPLLRHASGVNPEVWAMRLTDPMPSPAGWPVLELGMGANGWRRWPERFAAWREHFETREELRFATQLRRSGVPDLVHAHFGPQGFAAAEPCRRAGIPLVTTFYGYDVGLVRDPGWARRYGALWRNGSVFLAEGPFMARRLAALGAPPGRIRLQPLPVPVQEIPYRAREWQRDQPLQLLQVARFVEKKGVDMSVRAVARVPGVVLTVVGDGPLRRQLETLVKGEGVDDRVRFLGSRTHTEVQSLLLSSDLLIQPSRTAADGDTEGGAPYILLEAQASGLCVIASDHADIPNTCAPEAWFGFAENDLDGLVGALQCAMNAASEWPARGRAARAYVERRHAAARLVAELEASYATLCGQASGSGAAAAAKPPA